MMDSLPSFTIRKYEIATEIATNTLTLSIIPSGANFNFRWSSQPGKTYDLVSSPNLSTPIISQPVWDGRSNVLAGGTTTTLTNVPGGGATRFFRVLEK